MTKVWCYKCNDLFNKQVPKHEGYFPIVRICPHCKARNEIDDFDRGVVIYGKKDTSM